MSIESDKDLEGMQRVGAFVAMVLDAVGQAVDEGISTLELDQLAKQLFLDADARSAPAVVYGFPGTILISVNDEIVHGIPGPRRLMPGDVVKLDVTAELDGYVADAARTILIPPVTPQHRHLAECAESALESALPEARSGRPVSVIGKAVETEVRHKGFSIIRDLFGHGTGRTIHEDPMVLNYFDPRDKQRLTDGLVLTIEPLITTGSGQMIEDADGWTVRTKDAHMAAHHEQTIVITNGDPIVLTKTTNC